MDEFDPLESDSRYQKYSLNRKTRCYCGKHGIFGFSFEEVFCKEHKLEGMENIKHKKCEHNGCKKRSCYGLEGEKLRFCAEHKLEGMENIESTKCEHNGCKKQPCYGFEGEKRRFCKEHKLKGMENIRHKKCEHNGCKKRSCYGLEGEKPRFCAEHKLEGMENIKDKKCEHNECKKQPCYGFEFGKAVYCASHALAGMKNCKKKRCIQCVQDLQEKQKEKLHRAQFNAFLVSEKYKKDELCKWHGAIKYKDTPSFKRQTFFFEIVKDVLGEKYKVKCDKHDAEDLSKCTRFKPDITILADHVRVYGEFDENQHKAYSCEDGRMNDIAISGEIRHSAFIRVNPDTWKDENGVKRDVPITQRINDWIELAEKYLNIDREWKYHTEIVYLYYNGDKVQTDFIPMTPEEWRQKNGKKRKIEYDSENSDE